jgi:predicted DNA-binding transcriptional regulator AlpA
MIAVAYDEPEWLSNRDLAGKFNVSIYTVRGWRRDKKGPRGVRIGGRVRYHRDDVAAWIRKTQKTRSATA